MQSLGQINVGSIDLDVEVGPVTLPAGTDALYVRMTQIGGSSPWLFSFGLLSWRSANGRELGTVKAYPHLEGELYRLGVGLSPVERTGSLWFSPRSYNLAWVKSGERLSLSFQYEAGSFATAGADAARSFVSTAGAGLDLIQVRFP
jgi:hypothetical protein